MAVVASASHVPPRMRCNDASNRAKGIDSCAYSMGRAQNPGSVAGRFEKCRLVKGLDDSCG